MNRRRKLNRLPEFDYSSDALYFITSCVHDKICCFGEISGNEMHLNEYGRIAETQWLWLEKQYPYVNLLSYVIMPNHMHGIIEINKHFKTESSKHTAVGTGGDLSIGEQGRDLSIGEQGGDLSLKVQDDPIKIKSLSELIGAYKTTTSKKIHLTGYIEFKWQRSFHDHIIRDAKALEKITNYIENNPANWDQDMFYK